MARWQLSFTSLSAKIGEDFDPAFEPRWGVSGLGAMEIADTGPSNYGLTGDNTLVVGVCLRAWQATTLGAWTRKI